MLPRCLVARVLLVEPSCSRSLLPKELWQHFSKNESSGHPLQSLCCVFLCPYVCHLFISFWDFLLLCITNFHKWSKRSQFVILLQILVVKYNVWYSMIVWYDIWYSIVNMQDFIVRWQNSKCRWNHFVLNFWSSSYLQKFLTPTLKATYLQYFWLFCNVRYSLMCRKWNNQCHPYIQ